MTEKSFSNESYKLSDDEISRNLTSFRHLDADRHNEFINHVSIGISVAISIVVLLGLYIISSILVDYGVTLYELGSSNHRLSSDAKDLMLLALVVFIFLVIFMSAFCLRFLRILRKELIHSVEESFQYRNEKLGKNQ